MHRLFELCSYYEQYFQGSDQEVWNMLEAMYNGPSRPYHNLDHAVEVVTDTARLATVEFGLPYDWTESDLDDLQEIEVSFDELLEVMVAGWFHDAFNNTRRTDNEDLSYTFFWMVSGENSSALIRQTIEATKGHIVAENIRPVWAALINCFLDADLARFASEEFPIKWERAIRAEWIHVPQADYTAGRLKVLRGFLSRDRIYQSKLGHELWEMPARENLRTVIHRLENS